ncbi:MAG: phosphate--AMP phosphotransferase, partial [Lachnospiraceae bacterium]|nr:phosphate--AMP phosphotransferase [Lachnospiraceae bacterium]
MLKDFVRAEQPEDEQLSLEVKQAREQLAGYQTQIKEAKLPVMVIFEGWGAAGKGSVIGRVIRSIDPRFFRVTTMSAPTPEEKRYPFLHRYFREIPEAGKFQFFDTYWMNEVVNQRMSGDLDDETYKKRVRSINNAERSLTDNGYLVMKFFFHISRKEQKKRLEALQEDKNARWRVTKDDLRENKHYDEYLEICEQFLEDTNRSSAPWYIIDAKNKKWAELRVLRFLNQGIDTALKNHALAAPILQNVFPLRKTPLLSEVSLADKTIADDEYKTELDRLQKELSDLHNEIYRRKIPVIIAYEGWDAAGKGGNIRRVAYPLDPRGFDVQPIASPLPHELNR